MNKQPSVSLAALSGGISSSNGEEIHAFASLRENASNYFASARVFFATQAHDAVDAKKLQSWRDYVERLTKKLESAIGERRGPVLGAREAASCRSHLLERLQIDGIALRVIFACATGEELEAVKAKKRADEAALALYLAAPPTPRPETPRKRVYPDDAISIAGLDKAALLAALYNASRPLGMGILQAESGEMAVDEARQIVDSQAAAGPARLALYFDYVKGRPLKVDLSGDWLEPRLFDRDNGEGRAAAVVAQVTEKARQL